MQDVFFRSMIIGIVGKANVGKSTFFKSLTLADALIANYPFATIEPNKGFGFVRVECVDKFFNVKCNPRHGFCRDGIRYVPVEVIDVAGLVPGAHEGKGMGNQFLDDLRQADALIHVVDMAGTTNEKGEPVSPGSYDPVLDVRSLEEEINLWFAGILKKGWERFARTVMLEKKEIVPLIAKQLSGLNVKEEYVELVCKELKLDIKNPVAWTEQQLFLLAVGLRKMTKTIIIAANKMDISSAKANLNRVKAEFPDIPIIACSAESELALKEADQKGLIKYLPGAVNFELVQELSVKQKQALEFIRENVLNKFGGTGVQQCVEKAVFDVLKYIAVFPGGMGKLGDQYGNILPDCFLLPPGSTALDFAYKIHSDLGDKFVKAFDVKTRQVIGKDHKLKHGDVVEIVTRK